MHSSSTEIRSSCSPIAGSMPPASFARSVRAWSVRAAAAWRPDMRALRGALACMIAAGAFAAQAQDKPCTKADEGAAAKAIDRVVTWPQLHKTWQDYRQCDTGAVDEAF